MRKRLSLFISICILIVCCFGCQNLLSDDFRESSEISQNKTPFLTLNFNELESKTVNPQTEFSNLTDIELKGTLSGENEATLFSGKTYAEITAPDFSVPLEKTGTYSFVMTAKLNERNYSCSLADVEIKNGNNSLIFVLSFINQDETFVAGNGNLNVDLKIKNHSEIKYAAVCLLKNDNTVAFDEEKINKTEDGIFTYSKKNIPAGNYTVKYSFYDSDALLGYYMESVNISKDLSSTAVREVESVAEYSKITFELNGAKWIDGYEGARVYSKFSTNLFPSRDKVDVGVNFLEGWYYDSNFSEKATVENIKNKTGDITLYAKYGFSVPSIYASELIAKIEKAENFDSTRKIVITDENPGLSKIAECLKNENVKVGIDLSNCTGLTEIGMDAFRDCNSLTGIVLPDSVKKIETYAFCNCSSMESVKLSDNITEFCNAAFYGCTKLSEKFILPESLVIIGTNAFQGCSSIPEFVFSSGLTEIGIGAFSSCKGLSGELILPVSLKTIGFYAFYSCSKLSGVIIPEGVTEIQYNTFDNCTNLSKVVIPNSVSIIGENVFNECSSLQNITCPCRFKNSNVFGKNQSSINFTWTHSYSEGKDICDCGEEAQGIKEGKCGENATYKYGSSSKILLIEGSGTVTSADFSEFAFEIETVKISNDIQDISVDIFAGCSSLKTVEAPCGLKKLSYFTGKNCKWQHLFADHGEYCECHEKHQKVTTGKCGENAQFKYCEEEKVLVISGTGDMYDKPFTAPEEMGVDDPSFMARMYAEKVEICDGITKIGVSAFFDFLKLKEVVMADSVTEIARSAFAGGVSFWYDPFPLEKITLSKNLKTIGSTAFFRCESLKEITIPESVETIGAEAFEKCVLLENIVIPDSVKNINTSVFNGCDKLKTIKIGTGIKSIDTYAFFGCPENVQITAPESLKGNDCFEDFSNIIWY